MASDAGAGVVGSTGALPVSILDAAHGAPLHQDEAGRRNPTRQQVLDPRPAQGAPQQYQSK